MWCHYIEVKKHDSIYIGSFFLQKHVATNLSGKKIPPNHNEP